MREYISLATQRAELVDCRMLQMEIEFFNATKTSLQETAVFCFEETHKLLQSVFWTEWTFNSQPMNVEKLRACLAKNNTLLDFDFCGDVFSDIVYNKKTFYQYDRELRCVTDVSWEEENVSTDYYEAFAQMFSASASSEQIKTSVLTMFNQPNRKMVAFWRKHDVNGYFFSFPHSNNNGMYYGKYRFSVGASCLGDHIVSFSDKLVTIACELTKRIPCVSCRIALSPIAQPSPCSGYMEYFGGKYIGRKSDIPTGVDKKEWLSQNYLLGAEWFNIVSKNQSWRIPNLQERGKLYDDVLITQIAEGSFIVCSKKDIISTDVPEYTTIKKILYEGLYPGEGTLMLKNVMDIGEFGYMAKPRWRWELVPVFENEISVLPDRIVLTHL